jgi:hypothetical protein
VRLDRQARLEFDEQPRLSDAWLAGEQDDPPVAGLGLPPTAR